MMATKPNQSSGGSRGQGGSRGSEREQAKPAEARARSQDADNAQHEAPRSARGKTDEKREQASPDREHREGDARSQAEAAEGSDKREQGRKDQPTGRNQRDKPPAADNAKRLSPELDLGQ